MTLTIGALQLIAGGDVVLTADSSFAVTASADTDAGGGIQVGTAESSADLGDSPTSITIAAGSTVSAGRDVTAEATTDHSLSSSARAMGGGFVSVNTARTRAFVDNDVTIVVGGNANVTAGRALQLDIASNTTASTSSQTWGVGAGAVSKSDNDNDTTRGVRIGTAVDPAMRSITVGAGAQLTGRTVELDAAVTGINLTAFAEAKAYCPIFCYAEARADPEVDIYSRTLVQVLGNAIITGVEGVDLKAHHVDTVPGSATSLNIVRRGFSEAVAIVPPQHTNWRGTDSLTNEVNTDANALVIAGARRAGTPPGGLFPSPADLERRALRAGAHRHRQPVRRRG